MTLGDDGTLSASATLKQTDWGMKPYSALFGALKVADEVEIECSTPARRPADSVAVDRLRVEAALDAGRQLAACRGRRGRGPRSS